jgi:hypothetical protein
MELEAGRAKQRQRIEPRLVTHRGNHIGLWTGTLISRLLDCIVMLLSCDILLHVVFICCL